MAIQIGCAAFANVLKDENGPAISQEILHIISGDPQLHSTDNEDTDECGVLKLHRGGRRGVTMFSPALQVGFSGSVRFASLSSQFPTTNDMNSG
jgi:hypothetical protein